MQFLTQVLPRLREYSDTLNRKEIFVDKTWLLIANDTNIVEFTFTRNAVYKAVAGGQGKVGKWRLLTSTKQIWIEFDDGESYMLKQLFVSDIVLLLSDNVGSNFFPFVNTLSEIRSVAELQNHLERVLAGPPRGIERQSTRCGFMWDVLIVVTITIVVFILLIAITRWQ